MAKSNVSPESINTIAAAAVKKPRAPRVSKKKAAAPTAVADQSLTLAHVETIESSDAGDMALNDLIAELNGDSTISASTVSPDEVIEPRAIADSGDDALDSLIADLGGEVLESAAPEDAQIDTSVLDSAVSSAEAAEVMLSAATPDGVLDAGAAPTGDMSDVTAAGETPAKEKRTALPRKHYSDKTERLKDKLGDGLGEYTVLTLTDAGVDEAALKAKMDETLVIIKAMNGKAQNWAVKFIEYLAGKKSSLSEVTARTLKVLERDGFISTGAEGNVFKDLIARPYSPGAARAMGGNNLAMMRALKVVLEDGKGRYIANADSLLLMKVSSMMKAVPAAALEAAAA